MGLQVGHGSQSIGRRRGAGAERRAGKCPESQMTRCVLSPSISHAMRRHECPQGSSLAARRSRPRTSSTDRAIQRMEESGHQRRARAGMRRLWPAAVRGSVDAVRRGRSAPGSGECERCRWGARMEGCEGRGRLAASALAGACGCPCASTPGRAAAMRVGRGRRIEEDTRVAAACRASGSRGPSSRVPSASGSASGSDSRPAAAGAASAAASSGWFCRPPCRTRCVRPACWASSRHNESQSACAARPAARAVQRACPQSQRSGS